jgi:co-chaperonin GroES (HSP10)
MQSLEIGANLYYCKWSGEEEKEEDEDVILVCDTPVV